MEGEGIYLLPLPGMLIIAGIPPAIGAGIDDFRIARIRRHVTTLAAAHRIPIGPVDASAITGAGNAHSRVVLLRAVHEIGKAVVCDHVVELRGGLIVLACPTLAGVGAYVGATVIGFDHAVRITGVNPQTVIVTMGNADLGESLSCIQRVIHASVQNPQSLRRAGIGKYMSVIKSALAVLAVGVSERPGVATVIRAE